MSTTTAPALSQSPSTETHTLWLWPTGLFPRRLIYYLRAKHISASILRQNNITLIPVYLDRSVGLLSKSGLEERPTGLSLPCMRIQKPDGEEHWVHESMAIMGYLEEIFPVSQGFPNLLGDTIEQRSRTRDILSLLGDAAGWHMVSLIHGDPNTLWWTGLTKEQMGSSASKDAKSRLHKLLSKLEGWMGSEITEKGYKSLSGEGAEVTLADVVLMANVMYNEESYGTDWIEEHGSLRVWCERAKMEKWFVERKELEKCEMGHWDAALVAKK